MATALSKVSVHDLWLQVLKEVEPAVKRPHFLTWFQNTAILSSNDGLLVVGVPNVFAKDWLEHKINGDLVDAVRRVSPDVKEVMIEVDPNLALPDDNRSLDVNRLFGKAKKTKKVTGRQEVKLVEGVSSKCLNPKYTLKKYVVGPNNRLAHAACDAVAKAPGALYNPTKWWST